jgi:hypothetical protein
MNTAAARCRASDNINTMIIRAFLSTAGEVWAFDEHRVSLKPVLRRQWAPKEQRPIACASPRYEWLYLYAFVPPATG